MELIDKREVLFFYANSYLQTIGQGHLFWNGNVLCSNGTYSTKYQMFLALAYPKEQYPTLFSIDIDVSEDERANFIDKEYNKLTKINESNIQLGKTVLDDSEQYYIKRYTTGDTGVNLDEIGQKFNF